MTSIELSDVRRAAPPAPWIGGKRNLARRVIERLEAIPHTLYAEPFLGMGGIFLRRERRPPVEVVNDRSREVANLFRILQRHYQAFMDILRWQLTSRADFDRLNKANPDTLTDLERAARFLYLQRTAFGGKVAGQSFGVSRTTPARFDVVKLGPLLDAVHERLSSVVIECLDFEALMRRYDRPGALFYVDPPYVGGEGDYGPGLFSRADFERLATVLRQLSGRWLLSLNDRPEVRQLFAGLPIEEIATTYTLDGGAGAQPARELLIGDGDDAWPATRRNEFRCAILCRQLPAAGSMN